MLDKKFSLDEVLEGVYKSFAFRNGTLRLGKRKIGVCEEGREGAMIRHAPGIYNFIFDSSLVLPNGLGGYLISNSRLLDKPRNLQFEGGISYTRIKLHEKLTSPILKKMFRYHVFPPNEERVGIVKAGGSLVHYCVEGIPQEIENFKIEKAEYNFVSPYGTPATVIVFNGFFLDDRFTKLEILKEAKYSEGIVEHLVRVVESDLDKLPVYEID